MKKIFAILACVTVIMTAFTGCSNGKCDECGQKKGKITKVAKQAGLSGEYCNDCVKQLEALIK